MQLTTKEICGSKLITRGTMSKVFGDKERHYKMVKLSQHKEYIMIINTYSPNIIASEYMKQTLAKLNGNIILQ